MAKIIFTISYEIHSSSREVYLSLAEEMKQYFQNVQNKNFSIYEQQGKKNMFSEVFVCASEEEYETLEDTMNEDWQKLLQRQQPYIIDGKTSYSTLIEISA